MPMVIFASLRQAWQSDAATLLIFRQPIFLLLPEMHTQMLDVMNMLFQHQAIPPGTYGNMQILGE